MRTVKADLHNHLRTSSRMKGMFNPAIDKALARLGPGGVIGLVNFEDSRYERFSDEPGYERQSYGCALYVPEKDILVVKGQEVPTQDGHLLVLGLRKGIHLRPHRKLTETLMEAADNSGIIIADHPFYTEGIGPFLARNYSDIIMYFDALEGHNASASLYIPGLTTDDANREAQLVYDFIRHDCPNLGFISTSDGHSLYELGKSHTKMQMPPYECVKSAIELKTYLRDAIRKSRPDDCVMSPGRLGCFMHLCDLVALSALRKIGVNIK